MHTISYTHPHAALWKFSYTNFTHFLCTFSGLKQVVLHTHSSLLTYARVLEHTRQLRLFSPTHFQQHIFSLLTGCMWILFQNDERINQIIIVVGFLQKGTQTRMYNSSLSLFLSRVCYYYTLPPLCLSLSPLLNNSRAPVCVRIYCGERVLILRHAKNRKSAPCLKFQFKFMLENCCSNRRNGIINHLLWMPVLLWNMWFIADHRSEQNTAIIIN